VMQEGTGTRLGDSPVGGSQGNQCAGDAGLPELGCAAAAWQYAGGDCGFDDRCERAGEPES
jgi:hypothetical protein